MCAGGRASRALYVLYTSPPPLRPARRHASCKPRRPLPAPVPYKSRRPSPVVYAQDNDRRPPCAIHGVIASRCSPPAMRAGIGAQRTRPRPAAPTHCAFPPAALHPPCPFPACRALPTACTLLAFPTAHQPHAHAARCALHSQALPAHDSLRSFGPNPTTRRPPPATRHPLCVRASYVPPGIVRTPTRPWYYLADRCPSGGSLTLRFGHCVHENNMAGVVGADAPPCSTRSVVATAGARDAPLWTRLKCLKGFACRQRASCLMLDARRPPLTARHQLLAVRGSLLPAVPASRKIQHLPHATRHPPLAQNSLPPSAAGWCSLPQSLATSRSLPATRHPSSRFSTCLNRRRGSGSAFGEKCPEPEPNRTVPTLRHPFPLPAEPTGCNLLPAARFPRHPTPPYAAHTLSAAHAHHAILAVRVHVDKNALAAHGRGGLSTRQ
ncbi:hypothetical protein GGX14DRAFT_600968 [Mycena pura]|uniref:Uncharacterized protein n=1 Tax=Mycena pura TaxID=153505 RepID=A0AAD6USB3_9AGAR|nr:hypothetical protein GGX14DRAFT_600968 [Mycena pura]